MYAHKLALGKRTGELLANADIVRPNIALLALYGTMIIPISIRVVVTADAVDRGSLASVILFKEYETSACSNIH